MVLALMLRGFASIEKKPPLLEGEWGGLHQKALEGNVSEGVTNNAMITIW